MSENPRTSGILLPVFSTRREGDLGIGDTLALRHWIDWAANHQVGFLQLLPINENGTDESPYSAISSVALDPVYLAMEPGEIPGLTTGDVADARAAMGGAADAPRVDYPAARGAKRSLLELAWSRRAEMGEVLSAEFASFRSEQSSWLDDYCLFRWLMEIHGGNLRWDEWPEGCDSVMGARRFLKARIAANPDATLDRTGFFAFVQWLCFRQWNAVAAHASERGVSLMGDVPIGVSWHSCDVFFERGQFRLDWFGGTPPEVMFGSDRFLQNWGQNWGIPLYDWQLMAGGGYEWWQRRIRHLTAVFGMFRLDHILGFYRIYAFPWHPSRNGEFADLDHDAAKALAGGRLPHWVERPDDTPENKEANLADGTPRLKAVVAAADGAGIIAEDLGWTPEYVRPNLESLGISGYRIPHWDCDSEGNPLPGDRFTETSFAAYSTHDHDPLGLLWDNCARAANAGDAGCAHALRALSLFAGLPLPADGHWPAFGDVYKWRLLKSLYESRSRYVCVAVTELFDLPERINTPGTTGDANWSFRLPWTLADIRGSRELRSAGDQLAGIIGATRRG